MAKVYLNLMKVLQEFPSLFPLFVKYLLSLIWPAFVKESALEGLPFVERNESDGYFVLVGSIG